MIHKKKDENVAMRPHNHRTKTRSPTGLIRLFLFTGLSTFSVVSFTLLQLLQDVNVEKHPVLKQNEARSTTTMKSDIQVSSVTYSCSLDTGILCEKDKLIDILRTSNVDIASIDNETWSKVPPWSQITALYGDKPRILGLETCAAYRDSLIPGLRKIGPAGLFNTGTNLLAQLLMNNCRMKNRRYGIQWQVPWGKHAPPSFRGSNWKADGHEGVVTEEVLPVVAIREPYEWMNSICHNNYVLRWPHRTRCPNLMHRNGTYAELYNQYYHGKVRQYHKSLAHFWNDWNGQYTNKTSFPRLVLRHKDLVFFPKETTQLVCECAGGQVVSDDKFQYVLAAAKGNRKGAKPFDGLVGNWIKYGVEFDLSVLNQEDVKLASEILDPNIMEPFGYRIRLPQ